MDQRLGDLRERLHKKRAELSRMNGGVPSSPQTSSHPAAGVSGRVAAVCPYIQVPAEGRQEAGYALPADPPPKPTPLCHIRSLSEEDRSGSRKTPGQWKESDLDIVLSEPIETWAGPRSPQGGGGNNSESLVGATPLTPPLHRVRIAAPVSSPLHLHFKVQWVC
ncbi:Apoptosis-stimulating of p53 protein 1 [Liparis tanakae]|uniref:Apoptosis-stimulating of p53 protein 1 n=1 Tax=Liparis tanakae TaxID=230148 RepID=A0A4Z2ED76_9TELE|nr:Apoptosis-stimulating of p53 protein 1 [Liparis tanakae]